MTWFAVMTKARKEYLAFQNLKRQGYEAFFPHYEEWTTPKKTKPRHVRRPYLPRYIFCSPNGLPNHSVYNINNTIGVSTVVYFGSGAFEIPTPIMDELQGRADDLGRIGRKREQKPFPGVIGDYIRVGEGSPFFGLIGALKAIDKSGRITIVLDRLLGAGREISIDRAHVGAIISKTDGTLRPLEPTACGT